MDGGRVENFCVQPNAPLEVQPEVYPEYAGKVSGINIVINCCTGACICGGGHVGDYSGTRFGIDIYVGVQYVKDVDEAKYILAGTKESAMCRVQVMGIIKSSFSFIVGTVCGVYVAQNYNVPNIKKLADTALFMVKHVEEKYRKPKNRDDD
ncbi:hypothetical protein J1N35_008351 [Gossypium stocksii]|uniref:Uncharacterized protein n=10 Tax=Gossypium TaxID=3633 RepID=A0A9D4AGD9_9ROSI|nr:hypothetical protein J1N35_008351 [Gossypium stocksii]